MSVPINVRERMFYVIPMPTDKNGHGPADYKDTVEIEYEVWNQLLESVASFKYLPDAIQRCEILNREYYSAPRGPIPKNYYS